MVEQQQRMQQALLLLLTGDNDCDIEFNMCKTTCIEQANELKIPLMVTHLRIASLETLLLLLHECSLVPLTKISVRTYIQCQTGKQSIS